MQRFLNSLKEKITAHYGAIYLISFTKVTCFLIVKKYYDIFFTI